MAMSRTAPIFEIYSDRKGEFRWRARARNGNLLAAASEGYAAKRDAVHCAKLFGYDPTVVPPAPKKAVVAAKPAANAKASKAPAAPPAEAAPPSPPPRARKPKAQPPAA